MRWTAEAERSLAKLTQVTTHNDPYEADGLYCEKVVRYVLEKSQDY